MVSDTNFYTQKYVYIERGASARFKVYTSQITNKFELSFIYRSYLLCCKNDSAIRFPRVAHYISKSRI